MLHNMLLRKWHRRYLCLLIGSCLFSAVNTQADDSEKSGNAVQLSPFKVESFAKIRQKYDGDNYLVSLWSLNCPPCMKELEMLGRWRADNPDIPIVLIATDNIAEADQVSEVLNRVNLDGADNWIFADTYVEKLRYAIDPKWRGELPRTYLITPGAVRVVKGLLDKEQLNEWTDKKK